MSMSSPSSSARLARQALADRLKEIRVQAGLTAQALAGGAGWHRRGLVDDVAEAVAERMDRQRRLFAGDHRVALVLEEAALYYRIGGPHVLAGQLRHLLRVARLPALSLGIIPKHVDRSVMWPV